MVPTLNRTRGKECFVNLTMQAVHEKTVLEVLNTASPFQGKCLVQTVDEVLVLFHVCPPPAIFVSTITEIQYSDVFINPAPCQQSRYIQTSRACLLGVLRMVK